MINTNKRGISTIIATLILILLTVVLIGIVWVVVNNIVGSSTSQINSQSQCFNSGIQITAATCDQNGTYCNVTIQRTTGSDVIGGVRLAFQNAASQSATADIPGNVVQLGLETANIPQVNVTNVSSIQAAIYFGNTTTSQRVCTNPVQYTSIQLI